MKKVLIADPLSKDGLDILNSGAGIEVVVKDDINAAALVNEIKEYHAIVVRSRTKMTAEVIDRGERLEVIARGGVGLDNIDLEAAQRRGVKVVNTPEASSQSVAEHALGLCFALARQLPRAHTTTAAGGWEKKLLKGVELSGKTLGIVGLGRIGRELAKKAMGIGMRVTAADPFVEKAEARSMGIELVDMEDIIRESDFISLHTPLTPETAGLIGAGELDAMKPTAYLVNCARGGVVDESALCEALKAKKIAGAALDVFEHEPPADSPLLGLENIALTPHIAASPLDVQKGVGIQVTR